jgi:hypothetical protein
MTAKPVPEHISDERPKLDANEIWEFLFNRTKDAVPEELTNEILGDLAEHINKLWINPLTELQHRREAEAGADDPDEAYALGKRDGYEEAIQELDEATGGDGEFKGSTFPGETVDVPVMRQRIIDRLAASPSSPASGVRVKATEADVERVARALAADELGMGDPPAVVESIVNHQWRAFESQARVALSALGEHP